MKKGFIFYLWVPWVFFGVAACDGDKSANPSYEFNPPDTQCFEPPVPQPLATSGVVGDGTPASCTEATLRNAVEAGGNVTFDCGEAVTIGIQSEISVPKDTIIDGGGTVTLDGGETSRILHSEARVSFTVKNLTFENGNAVSTTTGSGGAIRAGWLSKLSVFDCTFRNNQAAKEGIEGGGAIYQSNGGELTVVRSLFEGNSSISGGAIDNLLSPMTLVDATFLNNQSEGGGGAVYTDGASAKIDDDIGGTISICGCTFQGNRSVGTGGAVYLWAYAPDELLINHCSFTQNSAYRKDDEGSALGGALRTGNAPLQIANSLFDQNHADVHGGAYWTKGEFPTHIVNSTFYRNTAGVGEKEGGYGGALSGFNMHLENLSFVENHAQFTGGAISAEGDLWTMNNCLFLNNSASNPWGTSQTCTNTIQGARSVQWPAPKMDQDPPCGNDTQMADPLLGDLGDNGGPTFTIPLLEASPCIDGGDQCPNTDQRGEPRQGLCDIGAFELQW